MIEDEEKGEKEVVTRFIYVEAKKQEPILVVPEAGIQVDGGGSGDDGLEEFIMVEPSNVERGLTLLETLLVVGIAILASCVVVIVLIKVLGCRKESAVFNQKGLQSRIEVNIDESDNSNFFNNNNSLPPGRMIALSSTHNSHNEQPVGGYQGSILASEGGNSRRMRRAESHLNFGSNSEFDENRLMQEILNHRAAILHARALGGRAEMSPEAVKQLVELKKMTHARSHQKLPISRLEEDKESIQHEQEHSQQHTDQDLEGNNSMQELSR